MEEITELAGCDALTISPALLQQLESSQGELPLKLKPDDSAKMDILPIEMNEKTFRWLMNEDAMATEKLAEGIRKFTEDLIKLENKISALL